MWLSPAVFGQSESCHGQDDRSGLWEWPRPARGSAPMAEWVPASSGPALLVWVADERAVCVPTWVVLTCGCKGGAEVDVNDAPDEIKARASCERGRTWWWRWCTVELRAWQVSAIITTTCASDGEVERHQGSRAKGE